MTHVIVLESVNEDIFVCGMCKTVFNSLELFLSHKQTKCAPDSFECLLTNKNVFTETPPVYNSEETAVPLETSIPQVKPTESPCVTVVNELTCTICKKKCKSKRGFKAHTKSHYEKSPQCLICGRCFNQNSHLQRHILTHKVWPESLSKTTPKYPDMDLLSYSCPYCKMMFANYNKFRSHLTTHQSFKKYKCIQGDCDGFYDTLESLLHHVSCCHIKQTYVCHVCYETFTSLESIANHEFSHNDSERDTVQSKQYKCTQCDAVFTKPEKLSLHMLTENHKKVCIHCKKTFASDKRLRLHLQIHRNLKPFECNICSTSFSMKKYLSTHMLKHGVKEHKCPVCKCLFSRSDLLRRHMRAHSAQKLLCPFRDKLDCKREFSRKDKLKLHIKSHNYQHV